MSFTAYQPLAERARPTKLSEYINQSHITSIGTPVYNMLQTGSIASMIFWGPPGTGKTTLAEIIAQESGRNFYTLSAINSGVKEIREIIDESKKQSLFSNKPPILFIDEIHRFNKSQQDSLLQAIEKGWIILIGATTENPSFEINAALLSRCQIYVLNELSSQDLIGLINKVITHDIYLKNYTIVVEEYTALLRFSGGDARKLLNALELVITQLQHESIIMINDANVLQAIQQNMALYDKTGEMHYDVISAYIKSIRGSDPQAAVYWLARMLVGGEDIKFIARRLIILASEDIGLANPNALLLANSTFQAIQNIGMPEARIILSQCTIYLATSPKSNSCYVAINKAIEYVKHTGDLAVPLHLRNAPTSLMKDLGYAKDYLYSHQFENNFIVQEFFPEEAIGTTLWRPGNNSKENSLKEDQEKLWKNKYNL